MLGTPRNALQRNALRLSSQGAELGRAWLIRAGAHEWDSTLGFRNGIIVFIASGKSNAYGVYTPP